MTNLTIKTGTEGDFFKRGRTLARKADRHESLPKEHTLSFEDPADMIKLITKTRLTLFRTIRDTPGSITSIASRLHRDRSAVKRDLDELERAGLVTTCLTVLPGHGRMKHVRVIANKVNLHAEV